MHLSNWDLIWLLIMHLISESIETNVKLSKTYFDYTEKFIKIIVVCNNNKYICCKQINAFYNKFLFDDSNYLQWTKRYSIDITIRFVVTIITGVYQLFVVILVGKYIYINTSVTVEHQNKLKKIAIEFTLISLFIEVVYYGCAIALHYKYNNDSLLDHCVAVWKVYKKEFILVFVCGLYITNYMYSNNVTGVSV